MKAILIADNELTRRMGLMHHRPLEVEECAYFYFEQPGRHSFWNKNVDFPISLIFCDKEGSVRDIKYLKAQQLSSVYPKDGGIQHVVEAHADAPEKFGIQVGKKLRTKDREIFFE